MINHETEASVTRQIKNYSAKKNGQMIFFLSIT